MKERRRKQVVGSRWPATASRHFDHLSCPKRITHKLLVQPQWLPFRLPLLGLILALTFVACTGGNPDEPNFVPSEGTGIEVADPFVDFYDEFGGLRVFGYPITAAFEDNGQLLQYFQTMRLEHDASQPAGEQIDVYPLGQWAYTAAENQELAPVSENGRSRFFPETGLRVQDEFLTFYERHNGQQLFGPPISPQLDEGGVRVQYFHNGRLEWRPELPRGQRVQVSLLGQAHFEAEMAATYKPRLLAQPVSSAGITAVDLSAAVRAPILYGNDEQVLYVTVLTPEGRPVSGITVQAQVAYDDTSILVDLGQTGEEGQLSAALDLTAVPPGRQVRLTVSAYSSSNQLIGTTRLSFKTWW